MAKPTVSEALEITILKNRINGLEGQFKTLYAEVKDGKVPDNIPRMIENLRGRIYSLKNRMSTGRAAPDDNIRVLALEAELGKWILIEEGVL